MSAARWLFVIEDDEAVVRTIRRIAPRELEVHAASSIDGAMALLAERVAWAAFLVDVQLADDAAGGLRVLEEIRRIAPTRPAALFTASREPRIVNRAGALDAYVLFKPASTEHLSAFIARGLESTTRRVFGANLEIAPFTPRERAILLARYDGLSDAEIAEREGIARRTVETHVQSILRKTGLRTLREVIARLRASN